MSNLSRTPAESSNTLDPRSYDSDNNSGEFVDRLRQDEEILGGPCGPHLANAKSHQI